MSNPVTEFLLKLSADRINYVKWIEDTLYYRQLHLNEMRDAGLEEEAILEIQTEWKQNLPFKIKDTFPTLTARETDVTVNFIFECGYDLSCLDRLFRCANEAECISVGHICYTTKFDLFPTASQLN